MIITVSYLYFYTNQSFLFERKIFENLDPIVDGIKAVRASLSRINSKIIPINFIILYKLP